MNDRFNQVAQWVARHFPGTSAKNFVQDPVITDNEGNIAGSENTVILSSESFSDTEIPLQDSQVTSTTSN